MRPPARLGRAAEGYSMHQNQLGHPTPQWMHVACRLSRTYVGYAQVMHQTSMPRMITCTFGAAFRRIERHVRCSSSMRVATQHRLLQRLPLRLAMLDHALALRPSLILPERPVLTPKTPAAASDTEELH